VGETAVGYRYLCRLQVYVSVNFAPLALQAGPGHLGNGLGHLGPAETPGDEAAGRPHSRVVYRVQRLENRLPVLDRYQRAEHPCRNVPEQRRVAGCLGCDLQCGGVLRTYKLTVLKTAAVEPLFLSLLVLFTCATFSNNAALQYHSLISMLVKCELSHSLNFLVPILPY
jgi:hypothetical protein